MYDEKRNLVELQARANLLTALFSHLSSDHEMLHSEHEKVKHVLQAISAERDNLRASFAASEAKLEGLTTLMLQLKFDLEEVRATCDAMITSTSWRITAPLRWIKDIRLT